jgi:hypothetical protein
MAIPRISPALLRRQWQQRLQAQAAAQDASRRATQAVIEAAWRAITDPHDPAQEKAFAEKAAAAIAQGRQSFADLTNGAIRDMLGDAGVKPPRTVPKITKQPRGIPITDEMLRATKEARYRISEGDSVAQALDKGLQRAQVMAGMDLALADREMYQKTVHGVPEVIGTRRNIHPELSKGGTCGLCIAAATRVYHKRDLLPLHDRCECTSSIVLADTEDLVQQINGVSLDELYVSVGETERQKLAKTRFTVHQHGELGPLLTAHGDHFRGPSDLAA